ncbi:pentatricopeptide repeat-containing protein At1g77360, mitochondrial-like [Vigna umbellata]|uniref:pentatricopeptide repeat-containing protein At1g77360, mitochondrial-like n=1 Tax=Vigna umbellata TaxID=87088 RepID=UPI001F5E7CD1|nr:pentatricopeptide repeat-containing protein At1g77360, mitochondrial-like [Vigna umbellata]XP_047153509.1 pentatricopeptide repeat-containing protein At1g77360, mitochondrial-like [Vigna umbellata]
MEESPRASRKRSHPFSSSSPSPPPTKRPNFPSFQDIPNLPSNIKSLCHLIATTSAAAIEHALEGAAVVITPHDVEEVLRLSYGFPGQAVKFFRWSGRQLHNNHTPYSWNLVVDLLGKNRFFDAMWDAIKSMQKEGLLSLATFASVFESYVIANRTREAIMAFEVMENYGCVRDVIALNSLLSAICRDGRTVDACDYLQIAKKFVRPDADSYAILMEGWEGEGDKGVFGAKETFAEMVIEIGWDPANVPAYDSFLCALVRGPDGLLEAIKFVDSMRDRRCYPGVRFLKVALDECIKFHDARTAKFFWEVLVEVGRVLQPTTEMYNLMIALFCYCGDTDDARRMLDEMVFRGAFPDVETYNLLFKFLIKGRKLREASAVFAEMVKNEFVPDQDNCDAAVKVYVHGGEPLLAMKVWKCLVENYQSDLERTANFLVVGLRDLNRVPEAVKYAEDMIGRGIRLSSSTLSKLRQTLVKERKEFVYEELLRKCNSQ